MLKTTCPFCLSSKTFTLKWDKRLKPYFTCLSCQQKIFLRNTLALASTLAWGATLEKLDGNEIRNLLLAGNNSFMIAKQQIPELEAWSNTEEATALTVENRRL